MSIKRRLNKVAKCLTPEIEAMNQGREMRDLTKRLEEIVGYCERKIAASRERKKNDGKSAGQVAAEAQTAERKRIQDIHSEEAEALAKDQEQAKAQPDAVHEYYDPDRVVSDEEAAETLASSQDAG